MTYKWGAVVIGLLPVVQMQAQEPVSSGHVQYGSPVDYKISLAGNFGEPRPNHFHGGLDIKTGGVEGKRIYSIGDGYVSRITQGISGFGNAVYITHPEGYVSIYCHLKAFAPEVKQALRKYQYAHFTSTADARLNPEDCPVKKGQFIALSGNTGSSTAPHLHLEIHDAENYDMLDPYEFIGAYLTDTVPPTAHSLMACPQAGEGVFNGGANKQTFGFASAGIDKKLTAWGRVGFALWADDHMQESYNYLGVRETILNLDGQEIFRAVVDRVPMDLNRQINAWGDYDHWLHHKTWYLKSFIEPGCRLPILSAETQHGIVDFNEERDYRFEYILRDYKGNEARYTFTVRGEKAVIPKAQEPASASGLARLFRWNQTNSLSVPGHVQLVVAYGLLTNDVLVQPVIKKNPDGLSDAYIFYPTSYPLVTDGEIYIRPHLENYGQDSIVHTEADPSKLYICSNGRYVGGEYRQGWVVGRIRELGHSYELDYDDVPPVVKNMTGKGKQDIIRLSVTDKQSGLASYTATIDESFVVFDTKEKTSMVVCDLRETPVKKTGKSHKLRFTAVDNRSNVVKYETDIIY